MIHFFPLLSSLVVVASFFAPTAWAGFDCGSFSGTLKISFKNQPNHEIAMPGLQDMPLVGMGLGIGNAMEAWRGIRTQRSIRSFDVTITEDRIGWSKGVERVKTQDDRILERETTNSAFMVDRAEMRRLTRAESSGAQPRWIEISSLQEYLLSLQMINWQVGEVITRGFSAKDPNRAGAMALMECVRVKAVEFARYGRQNPNPLWLNK